MEARRLSSTQEVLHSTVGWKSHGHNFLGLHYMLLVNYLPQKTTMTGPYYGEVLKNLHQAVKEKRENADPRSTVAAR